MKNIKLLIGRAGVVVLVAIALASSSDRAAAQDHRHQGAQMNAVQLRIPESMQVEHEEIHGALIKATQVSGRVGEAARQLAEVLHPHFVREEEIALPPLALLAPLAAGDFSPDMREVLPLTDALRTELPRMLREHEVIAAAARELEKVARAEENGPVEALAKALQLHARGEEEIFYPAALLVGDMVRARSPSDPVHGRKSWRR